MGRSRGGKGSAAYAVKAEDTDGVPARFWGERHESEDHLVAEVVDFLSDGPQEMQVVSAHFAMRFNRAVRHAPNSWYNPNKKNDGSFKKWLAWWGFEVSATYQRNKAMISIPAAGLPWAPGKQWRAQAEEDEEGDKVQEEEDPYVLEEPTASAGPFRPPHAKGTRAAQELETEAISYIRSRGPLDIGALGQINGMGVRFNSLFFHKHSVNDGSWKRWLVSLPGVELVTLPSRGRSRANHPTLARIRRAPVPPAQQPEPEGQSMLEALQEDSAAAASDDGASRGRAASAEPAAAAGGAEVGQVAPELLDPEDVPTYVFVDGSAALRMTEPEVGTFSFQGLLSLCQQGHMKCAPVEDGRSLAAMHGVAPGELSVPAPVREKERIVLAVTSSVLEELPSMATTPEEISRAEWLRDGADSPLQLCHAWGILEMLDTQLHRRTMRISPAQEQRALAASLPQHLVRLLDFAYLWDAQIEVEGRVILVTGDKSMQTFAEAVAREGDVCGRRVRAVHLDDVISRMSCGDGRAGEQLGGVACRSAAALAAPFFGGEPLSAAALVALVAMGEEAAEDGHESGQPAREAAAGSACGSRGAEAVVATVAEISAMDAPGGDGARGGGVASADDSIDGGAAPSSSCDAAATGTGAPAAVGGRANDSGGGATGICCHSRGSSSSSSSSSSRSSRSSRRGSKHSSGAGVPASLADAARGGGIGAVIAVAAGNVASWLSGSVGAACGVDGVRAAKEPLSPGAPASAASSAGADAAPVPAPTARASVAARSSSRTTVGVEIAAATATGEAWTAAVAAHAERARAGALREEALRVELQLAAELAAEVRPFLASRGGHAQAEACLKRLDDAQARWRLALSSPGSL